MFSSPSIARVRLLAGLGFMLAVGYPAAAQPPITYPIEVFALRSDTDAPGPATTRRRVDTQDFSGETAWLSLRVNNLNRATALSYRVRAYTSRGEAASWTDWQACQPDFTAFPKDGAYGGLGGGFGTVSFTTPVRGFRPQAQHEVEFRFSRADDDEASGCRILEMALWAANDPSSANLIENVRTETNPARWQGPFANRADRARQAAVGQALWTADNILQDSRGQPIRASCSGCHAENGYDLKYFNYSDESIISRANVHGLSREQGEQIAQYIRDLPSPASANGRPWNPPYQPGPQADDDAFEWAAGQGLKNVAEDDKTLLADMYGNTDPSAEQIETAIGGLASNTNLRTQRVAVQFPDWNEWLPVEHPRDLLSAAEFQRLEAAFARLRSSVNEPNQVATLNAKPGVSEAYANNGLFEAVDNFTREVHKVVSGNANLMIPNSPTWAANTSGAEAERRKRSLSAWMSVKMFEIIQTYQLHAIDDLQHIADQDEETFQWPSRQWGVFQNAAHVISGNRVTSYFLTDRTPTQQTKSIYLSSLWYQVQLTLTPGHRRGGWVEPNDYAYNLQHIHKLGERTGIYEPARFFQNYQKAAEQRSGATPQQSLNQYAAGWNLRELSPWRLWSTGRGNTALFDALPPDLRQRLREGYWNAALDVMERFTETDWPRTTINQGPRTDFHLEDREAIPQNGAANGGDCVFYDRRTSGGCEDANDAVEVDAIYTLLHLTQDGSEVGEATFNRLRRWADAHWKYTEWPVYEGALDDRSTTSVSIQAEDFTSRGPQLDPEGDAWDRFATYSGYQGGGYMATPPPVKGTSRGASLEQAARLDYAFEITRADTYHLWVRRFARGIGTNSAFFGVDEVAFDDVDNGEELFSRWHWVKIGSRPLDSGPHRLHLVRREGGYLVDAFLLTSEEEDPNQTNAQPAPVAAMSLPEASELTSFRLFPNPVRENTLEMVGNQALGVTQVALLNTQGTPVLVQAVPAHSTRVVLNVAGFPPGVYLLRAYGFRKTAAEKVVIE